MERIGIDRSVLCEFRVTNVDTEILEKSIKKHNDSQEKTYASITYDKDSPVELPNGKHIRKLVIKDSSIGKLTVSFEKNNLNSRQYVNTSLELMVSDSNNNLQNLSVTEYQTRIIEVFDLLEKKYGVSVDYSTISIKKLELNATFYLNEPYEKYRQPILLLIRGVPPKKYGKNYCNNSVKYATWHEANLQSGKDNLETVLVKNSSVELKIYNKGKHLKDIGELEELDKDIMRVEYTIKDRRILESTFLNNKEKESGANIIASLTDEKVNKLFRKYFNRDIAAPYYQWASRNHKQLVELTKKHREKYQKWTSTFFRECRQYEAVNGLPLLFDLENMLKVFKVLESKSGRNAKKKYDRFLEQAIYEKDLLGNTARTKEIISKIEAMYL